MSEETHQRDALNLIRSANPLADPDQMPDAPESLVEEIIGMTEPTHRPTGGTRRIRRVVLIAAAFLVIVASTAAAATWLVAPEDTTDIACNGEVIIPARSGDPVADCAAELDRRGIPYEDLVAYANPYGGVTVREAGDQPDNYTPLGEDFTQDAALIRLEEALEDEVDGIASRCMTSDEAVLLAEQYMADFNLDLPITVRSADLDGTGCAVGFVTNGREVIIAMDVLEPTDVETATPWDPFIARMSAELEGSCLTLDEAVPLADEIAVDTGIGYMSQLDAVADDGLECTELSVEVGGVVFIVLRGPVNGAIPTSRLPIDS